MSANPAAAKTAADAMLADAMAQLTSLTKASTGGTGLAIPATAAAFSGTTKPEPAGAFKVDGAAANSIAAIGRRIQLAHRVSTLASDAIVNGALNFARVATAEQERVAKAVQAERAAEAERLAKAADAATAPTTAEIVAEQARQRQAAGKARWG